MEPKGSVLEFYSGKSIFMTGASGFCGGVLLETLLRCVPGIQKIYILLRSKKDVAPEDRKEEILNKWIFVETRKHPELVEKIIVIPGDTSKENFGMCEKDIATLAENVSIIYYMAASTSFSKPLKYMLQQNAIPMLYFIDICRKFQNLEVAMYTSTAFSNSNQNFIAEKVYEFPISMDKIIQAVKNDCDAELDHIFRSCRPRHLNFYTFSKNIAENILQTKAKGLPIAIIRPSLIIQTWKGVLPSYAEMNSLLSYISVAVGKGFLRVLRLPRNIVLDTIPVDVVANTHIVLAFAIATKRFPSNVCNCASAASKCSTVVELIKQMDGIIKQFILPNSFQKPNIVICNNLVIYWLLSIWEHYIPALFIDFVLLITGQKPRLLSIYITFDKEVRKAEKLVEDQLYIKNDNFVSLQNILSENDRQLFYMNMEDFDMKKSLEKAPNAAVCFDWSRDKKTPEARRRFVMLVSAVLLLFKVTVLFTVLYFLWRYFI